MDADFNDDFDTDAIDAGVDTIMAAISATGLPVDDQIRATAAALGTIIASAGMNAPALRLDLIAEFGRAIAVTAYGVGVTAMAADSGEVPVQ